MKSLASSFGRLQALVALYLSVYSIAHCYHEPLLFIFFFRPSPSWLSPGRSTGLSLHERIVQKHAKSPYWENQKRAWTLTQSSICPITMPAPQQKNGNGHKTPNPNTKTKSKKRIRNKNVMLDSIARMQINPAACVLKRSRTLDKPNKHENITITKGPGKVQKQHFTLLFSVRRLPL